MKSGQLGWDLARWCGALLLLTLVWGPHWPLSRIGLPSLSHGVLNNGFDLADLLLIILLSGWGSALACQTARPDLRPLWVSVPLVCFTVASWLAVFSALDPAAALRFAIRSTGLLLLYLALRTRSVATNAPLVTPRQATLWLLPGLVLNGLLALAQYIHQNPLGLVWLYEPQMRLTDSGTAIVLQHGHRVLRAYGVLPHPNVLGGLVAAAIPMVATLLLIGARGAEPVVISTMLAQLFLSTSTRREGALSPPSLTLSAQGKMRYGIALCLFLLLLVIASSYSRSAWVGLVGGALFGAMRIWIADETLRRRWPEMLDRYRRTLRRGAIVVALLFAGLLFMAWSVGGSRLDLSANKLESLSIQQRFFLQDLTFKVIAWRPLTGVGGNNLVLAEARFRTLGRGQTTGLLPVHNTYLLAAAELGPLGALSWVLLMGAPVIGLRGRGRQELEWWQVAAGCSLIVVAVVGFFDFYIWVNEPVAVLWVLCLSMSSACSEAGRPVR